MALDAGWAGVIGAAMGIVGTLGGNALSYMLPNRRINRLARQRSERLRAILTPASGGATTKHPIWREMEFLCAVAGADLPTTTELLIGIDARPSLENPSRWALVAYAPWPADIMPKE